MKLRYWFFKMIYVFEPFVFASPRTRRIVANYPNKLVVRMLHVRQKSIHTANIITIL